MKKHIATFLVLLASLLTSPAIACTQLSGAMNDFYGKGNWFERGQAMTGTDIAPAIYLAVRASGEVCIDRGSWALKTPLDPSLISGSSIRGLSSQASKIYFQSATGAAFHFSGANGRTGGGLSAVAIILEDGFGLSNAIAVMLQGNGLYQPDQSSYRDLYITSLGSSYWYSGFFAHGVERTHPKGIRVVDISNVQVFKVHRLGIWVANAVQWSVSNIGVYVSTGTGQNLYVAGGGTAETNSELITISAASISGEINLTNTTRFDISAACTHLSTMPSAAYGRVFTMNCPVLGTFGPGVLVGR